MSNTLEISKQPKSTSLAKRVDKNAMNLAASWYIAMPSKDLRQKPKAIELFGQPLVAWRDSTGHPVIMERYCSHLGASLAVGEVVDGCIRCPYHHWLFESSGECVSAPDVENIPRTARQSTSFTVERYGYIWVWYGSQTPLFPLPEFPTAETYKHNYMPLRYTYDTKTTVSRLVESGGCDYYHGTALHKQKISAPVQFTIIDDQHPKDQHPALQSDPPIQKDACMRVLHEFPVEKFLVGIVGRVLGLNAKEFWFRSDIWPSGYRITGFADNREQFKILFCTTPIAEDRTIGHYFMMLKKTRNFLLDLPYYLLNDWQNKNASEEDLVVFNTQKADVGGAFVHHDRGILKFREFYQRWVERVA